MTIWLLLEWRYCSGHGTRVGWNEDPSHMAADGVSIEERPTGLGRISRRAKKWKKHRNDYHISAVCYISFGYSPEKNGKRGMLGHPSVHCWLLCFFFFLCYGSMFHPYLWCFSCGGFWDFFARTFTSLFGFRWGGDLLLLLCFFENGFVLELSLLNTSFVVFDFSLQM